ncbi:MAG: type II toxin-antitoxin system HicB family antitoxin [Thermoanaerobaculia bacterium]
MQHDFVYPATLTPDEADGGFVVTFADVPEAITQGEGLSDALEQGADALDEAIAGRIRLGDDIPTPSAPRRGQPMVPVPALTAAKAALHMALAQAGISKTELAGRLKCDEKEVRRLLDPRHHSKLPRIQAALTALGKRIVLRLMDEAA